MLPNNGPPYYTPSTALPSMNAIHHFDPNPPADHLINSNMVYMDPHNVPFDARLLHMTPSSNDLPRQPLSIPQIRGGSPVLRNRQRSNSLQSSGMDLKRKRSLSGTRHHDASSSSTNQKLNEVKPNVTGDRRPSGMQDDKTSPPSSSSAISKKPRLIKACEPCRLRKIGCDGTHPVCQRCRADKRSDECRFIRTIVRSSLTRKRMTELEDRLEVWERMWSSFTGEERFEGDTDVELLEKQLNGNDEGARRLKFSIVEKLKDDLINQEPYTVSQFDGPSRKIEASDQTPSGWTGRSTISEYNNGSSFPNDNLMPSNLSLEKQTFSQADGTWRAPVSQEDQDGPRSFSRAEGDGCSYLGLSSGVTFLNAILRLCKERGGIFIDVENSIAGGGATGAEGQGSVPINEIRLGSLALRRESLRESSSSIPGSPISMTRVRKLPPQEEFMPLVNGFFQYFNGITPLVHEPTVRATLTGKIPFPKSDSYFALMYMIFAMGALDCVSTETGSHGAKYYDIARSILNADMMEGGSLELVQAVAIMANYLQRNDNPNAGYLLLGLAVRMAIGIGLHVHEIDPKTPPLVTENRKRTWWSLAVLESGCSKTFGRPSGMCGVNLSQIPLPLNIDDDRLTRETTVTPPEAWHETLYSTLIAHSKLACATTKLHTAILQLQPAPSLEQIKHYDQMIVQVIRDLPEYMINPTIPVQHTFPRYVLLWRLRDWRAILYRPILLAAAWDQVKEKYLSPAIVEAISICRSLATANLGELGEYARAAQARGPTRAEEWYCMYFAHQSSLTLLLSLVGEPAHVEAENWRQTILATATWFRQLRAMRTAGVALASILENVVFATASIPIRDQSSITPTDNWMVQQNAGSTDPVPPTDSIDVMRYWNALCPDGASRPVWDDSIWNAMFSLNPEAMG